MKLHLFLMHSIVLISTASLMSCGGGGGGGDSKGSTFDIRSSTPLAVSSISSTSLASASSLSSDSQSSAPKSSLSSTSSNLSSSSIASSLQSSLSSSRLSSLSSSSVNSSRAASSSSLSSNVSSSQASTSSSLTSSNSSEWIDTNHDVLYDPNPDSTLLPPGATSLAFSLSTNQSAFCRYAVGADKPWSSMTEFSGGQGSRSHGVTFMGLNPDTSVVNYVYVRCDAALDKVLVLRYRAMPSPQHGFPRKSNLWGWNNFFPGGNLDHAKRIDLWMGVHASEAQVKQLRSMNPNAFVLDSASAVEQTDTNGVQVPDSYWLRDTKGQRIEVWNGTYRLNLTKLEVAHFQARYAYKRLLDSNLSMDGIFFDNFFTRQAWFKQDKWGNAIEVDANGDGKLDDPEWLDAEWRKGVYAELNEFRRLMPHALTVGHLEDHDIAEEGRVFNGDSLGFVAPWVKEGRYGSYSLAKVWDPYHSWWGLGRSPVVSIIEGAPPSELGYGYGEQPVKNMPAPTLEFARNFYPYMRWGLGVALMNDGYYNYSQGDSGHGLDWWYDEFDVDLGFPKRAYERINLGTTSTADSVSNGSFEAHLSPSWQLSVNASRGAAGLLVPDTAPAGSNSTAARVDINEITIDPAGNVRAWDVALQQMNFAVTAGVAYDISFRARSTNAEHPISISLQKPTAPYSRYLEKDVTLKVGINWQAYSGILLASMTATDGRLSLNLGSKIGTVWIDDVKLVPHQPDIFRRDFDNGTVILNASESRQIIPVTGTYKRINGTQAPRYQYVVDDSSAAFMARNWESKAYDSGQGVDKAPWYHDWGSGCHQSSSTVDTAVWDLGIRADDTYTLDAWWPAAPSSSGWSSEVRYEVIENGVVLSSIVLDQTKNGDTWNRIASIPLARAAEVKVRVTNLQAKPAIADAILVQSMARFNDGSDAVSVELDAYDAIILLNH